MPAELLTDVDIRKAKPRDEPFKLSDGKGLYLLVTPAGKKLWRLRYRLHGRESMLSLGEYGADRDQVSGHALEQRLGATLVWRERDPVGEFRA